MNPFGVIPSPGLVVRALEDLHRIARMSDELADLGKLNRNLEELSRRLASLDRQLENVGAFGKDLDTLGAAASELMRTVVLLRKTTENIALNFPGSRMLARRASRRRAAEGEEPGE